jgi:drug/metabolite transporter superfamily protein YnfA
MSAIDVTNTTEVYGDGAGSAAAGVKLLPGQVALSLLLFVVAGVAEIDGGWLVWVHKPPHTSVCKTLIFCGTDFIQLCLISQQALRENKPAWYALAGAVALIGYGVIRNTTT